MTLGPWLHRGRVGVLVPALVGMIAGLGGITGLGCRGQRPVEAQSLETNLTEDEGVRVRGYYSPDSRWIAYSDMSVPERSVVHVMASDGSGSRALTALGSFATAMGWTPDSRFLLVYLPVEARVQRLDLEGQVIEDIPAPTISKFEDISPDGKFFLWCRLNGDNYDIGLVETGKDTAWHALEETPTWEVDGCFGPGAEDVTIARQGTLNASTCELGVYSMTTHLWTPLPLPKARNHEPAWSPDGSLLAFVSDRAGSLDLWIYDTRNTRLVQITSTPEDEVQPDWSPDATRIMFSRVAVNSHVFVGDPVAMTRRQHTDGEARDVYPRVSSDGRWIAFFRKLPPSGHTPAPASLCVTPTEGGEVTVLDLGNLVPAVGEFMISWSPDAAHLAFSADDGTGNVDIYRIAREGGRPDRVTIEPGMDAVPAWSPDGLTLAYTRLAGGETQIWTVPANGGLSIQRTDHAGLNHGPVWAPDSRYLAYLSSGTERTSEIRYLPVHTPGESRVLLTTNEQILPYAWSADGKTVLFFRGTSKEWGIDGIGTDGKERVTVAEGLEKENRFFARFRPGFESYRDRIYPGGANVFTDGERTAQLVAIDAARLLAEGFQAYRD